jgi:O-antigen ligase
VKKPRRAIAAVTGYQGMSLRGVAFGLIVAAGFCLPFEFTKTWFPVSWIELSRVFMAGAMVVTGWLVLRGRRSAGISLVLVAAAVMIAVDGISRLVHPNAGDLKDLLAGAVYLIFAAAVGWNVRDARQIRVIAVAVVASIAIVAAVGVLEEIFNFYLWDSGVLGVLGRRNSTLADANITARVLSLGLMVLVGLFASRPRWRHGELLVAAVLAVGFGLAEALTQSRTLWIVTIGALILWIPVAVGRRSAFVPMAAFALAMVAVLVLSPSVGRRAATLDPLDQGAATGAPLVPAGSAAAGPTTPVDGLVAVAPLDEVRRYLIRAGVAMWLDNPIVGVGFSGFEAAIRGPYWAYVPSDRRADPTTLPHTDAVRILAETGLVGFAAYLFFLAALVTLAISCMRRPGSQRAFGMTILTATGIILLASQFEGRFTDEPYLWLLVGIVSGLPAVRRGAQLATHRSRPHAVAPVHSS